ncbi:MAG: actin, cytoplasmic 2 [Candidatus Hermodarchaeota archaeon]
MQQALVIDNGTWLSKNGFAGDDQPHSVFPTLVGYPRNSYRTDDSSSFSRLLFDKEAQEANDKILKVFPIENGIIKNWEAMEKIWHYIFLEDLRVNPSEHPVLLTERLNNPPQTRAKTAEILFESFNVPALYIANSSLLSLIASGSVTALIVHIGAGGTDIVPFYKGFIITDGLKAFDVGGREITDKLKTLLPDSASMIPELNDLKHVRDIKEKLCYVAQELKTESPIPKQYVLPSNRVITLDSERFLAPEILFRPLPSKPYKLHETVYESIQSCGIRLRRDFYYNIVLSGGTTLFPGFKERLRKELTTLVPKTIDVMIVAPPERMYSTWIGGSILASLKGFEKQWLTKKEYQEEGALAIQKHTHF